jgi:predicted nucleic acid-binding protein
MVLPIGQKISSNTFTELETMLASKLFLDASYVIALAVVRDEHHVQALDIRAQIQTQRSRLITTLAVALEIGNALSGQKYRKVSANLLEALNDDKTIEVLPVSEELYRDGLRLYKDRSDKGWSLTDCISFLVMMDRGLTDALTTDRHFEQAGFRALLRTM